MADARPLTILSFAKELMADTNYVGQRADKHTVVAATEDGYKEVEYYTMDCDECGGIGRYDQRGEVICQGCGMVLGGGEPLTLDSDARQSAAENTFRYESERRLPNERPRAW